MRSRPRWIAAVGLSVLILGSGLAGCSSPDTAEANAKWCDDLAHVQGEIQTLKVMVGTGVATVDQVEDQVNDVRNGVQSLSLAGADRSQAAVRDVQAAQAKFDQAIDDIPGTASVTDAKAAYRAALEAYLTDVRATATELGCPAPAAA